MIVGEDLLIGIIWGRPESMYVDSGVGGRLELNLSISIYLVLWEYIYTEYASTFYLSNEVSF